MIVRDHLQAIYNKHGKLTPEIVVEEARADDHPLHSHVFDKGVSDEAESWYRHKAHELIQSVRITYREGTERELSVRAFQAVRIETGYVYEPAEKVAQDPFLAKLVMADMEREWRQLKQRYESFREFWEIVRSDVDAAAA